MYHTHTHNGLETPVLFSMARLCLLHSVCRSGSNHFDKVATYFDILGKQICTLRGIAKISVLTEYICTRIRFSFLSYFGRVLLHIPLQAARLMAET